jgi:hypothetical protein
MHLRFVVEESVRHCISRPGPARENGLPPTSCHTISGNSIRGTGMRKSEALGLFLLSLLMRCVGVCAWTHGMDAEWEMLVHVTCTKGFDDYMLVIVWWLLGIGAYLSCFGRVYVGTKHRRTLATTKSFLSLICITLCAHFVLGYIVESSTGHIKHKNLIVNQLQTLRHDGCSDKVLWPDHAI